MSWLSSSFSCMLFFSVRFIIDLYYFRLYCSCHLIKSHLSHDLTGDSGSGLVHHSVVSAWKAMMQSKNLNSLVDSIGKSFFNQNFQSNPFVNPPQSALSTHACHTFITTCSNDAMSDLMRSGVKWNYNIYCETWLRLLLQSQQGST